MTEDRVYRRVRSYGTSLRIDLPLDLRMELTRLALEQHRSGEAQAQWLLELVLKRAAARRAKRSSDE